MTKAKKSQRVKKEKVAQPLQEVKQIAVAPIISDNVPWFYVNYVEVNQSQFETALTAVRMPPKFTPEQLAEAQDTGKIEIEATVQLVLPKSVIPSLIEALILQEEFNEKHFKTLDI